MKDRRGSGWRVGYCLLQRETEHLRHFKGNSIATKLRSGIAGTGKGAARGPQCPRARNADGPRATQDAADGGQPSTPDTEKTAFPVPRGNN